jgi:hypothetical protein
VGNGSVRPTQEEKSYDVAAINQEVDMATKIILLAQDIKIGTEIVQFALASGAAIMEYVECDSPLAKPKPKRKKVVVRRDSKTKLRLLASFVGKFQSRSLRNKAYDELLNAESFSVNRQGWVGRLKELGFSPTQSTTLVAGFIKQGALVEDDD